MLPWGVLNSGFLGVEGSDSREICSGFNLPFPSPWPVESGCFAPPEWLFVPLVLCAWLSSGFTLTGLCAHGCPPGEAASGWSPLLLMTLPGAVGLLARCIHPSCHLSLTQASTVFSPYASPRSSPFFPPHPFLHREPLALLKAV